MWHTVVYIIVHSSIVFLDVADAHRAKAMPCCLESLGISACTRLKENKPTLFKTKCETNADFAIVQCCHTCLTDVKSFGRKIFRYNDHSDQCFDRHKPDYCKKFVEKHGSWSAAGTMSCSGDGAALAFRICRKTCGYCERGLYSQNLIDPQCPVIG